MQGQFDRTISLIGECAFSALQSANVLVVGLGGVGGAVVEALVRSGIGRLTVVDGDVFEKTNLNRQLLCTAADLGKSKAMIAAERAKAINPDVEITPIAEFVTECNIKSVLAHKFDYCVDAIDDLKNKLLLVASCKSEDVPVVSAMGAGNRMNCTFEISDVYKTSGDPFARKFRHELGKYNISELDVACATKLPDVKRGMPASIAAPPNIMGFMLGQYVIEKLIKNKSTR